jgi:hypothetical protein
MKARLYSNQKIRLPDGSVISIVIWIAESTEERPHGFKYRLNFSGSDGATLVRYDNERGKGDHKHIGVNQTKYKFKDIDKLLEDFWHDVDDILEQTEND